MIKYRIGYLCSFLFCVLALLFEGNAFWAVLCIALAAAPFVFYLLLLIERQLLTVQVEVPSTLQQGQKIEIHISLSQKHRLLVAGTLRIGVEINNVLYDYRHREDLHLSLNNTELDYRIERDLLACGEVRVQFRKVILYDIFGLCGVRMDNLPEQIITVYPLETELELLQNPQFSGRNYGGDRNLNRKGSDHTEVFALREYHAGDDVRSIHWKLSSKMEQLVIRDASDTIDMNTLLLFDGSISQKQDVREEAAASRAISIAATISSKLVDQNINHMVGIVAGEEILMTPVTNHSEHREMLTSWMGIESQKQDHMGARMLLSMQKDLNFTRVIYVTTGECPDELGQITDRMEITAICVQDHAEKLTFSRKQNCYILNIPAAHIGTGSLRIYC